VILYFVSCPFLLYVASLNPLSTIDENACHTNLKILNRIKDEKKERKKIQYDMLFYICLKTSSIRPSKNN